MIVKPKIPEISCPALIDRALNGIQEHLTNKLAWLDYAFGKVEKQIDKDGKVYPGIYKGGNNYQNLLPDSHLGNYCYFDITDGQGIEAWTPDTTKNNQYTADFNLVFWFDFRKVYTDHEHKTVENVKQDVLTALSTARLRGVSFELEQIFERAENVYRGYTHKEIERNFTMRPYGLFKIKGSIIYRETC